MAELKSKVRLSGDAWLQSCPGGETAISQEGAANLWPRFKGGHVCKLWGPAALWSCWRKLQETQTKVPSLSLAPCSHINQSEISLETRKQREGVESCRWHRKRTLFSSNGNNAPVFPLDFINISGSVTLPPFVLSPHSPPAWKLHCADCWVEPARETRERRRNVVYATQKCSLCTANAILAR